MNASPEAKPLPPGISRRSVLGITVAGAAGLLTAACGGSSSGATKTAGGSSTTPSPAESSASPGASSGLVATADVPVGGGVFVKDGKIIAKPGPQEKLVTVVTQPAAGTFKAFDATCTHMACTVGTIKDGTILCPCHGSQYSIKDGSVTGGPAPKPLAAVAVKVDGDEIVKA